MAGKGSLLGNFEELVLLAVAHLASKGYGVTIRDAIENATGRSVSFGAVYATLDRLERKGYVSSRLGESTPERGGRPRRYYRLEGAGATALGANQKARAHLRPKAESAF